ncbi:PE family protein [Mycobacterium bourgelatii]|nr:PE family protein [Mycobacterium bourgelatii]
MIADPSMLEAAATDLMNLRSTISAANAASAAATTGLVAAAGDEVSAAIAALFSEHAQTYQELSARAEAFHVQFVQALSAGGGSYASAEASAASSLQNALARIFREMLRETGCR